MARHVCYMSRIYGRVEPIDYGKYTDCIDKPHMIYKNGRFVLSGGEQRQDIPSSITQWRDREPTHGQA